VKVGDLVLHNSSVLPGDRPAGIIIHIWAGGGITVLFEDGEYDVDSDDLEVIEVINENE